MGNRDAISNPMDSLAGDEEEERKKKRSVWEERLKEKRQEDIEVFEYDSPGVPVEMNLESKNVLLIGDSKDVIAKCCMGENEIGEEFPEIGICYKKKLVLSTVNIWVAESDVEYESLAEYLGKINALVVTFSDAKTYKWSKDLSEKILKPSEDTTTSSSPNLIFPIILLRTRKKSESKEEEEEEDYETFVKNKRMVDYFDVTIGGGEEEEEEIKKCFDFVFRSIDVF